MPYVTFTEAFDYEARQGVTIAYHAGYTGQVTTACAESAGSKCFEVARPADFKVGINETIKSGRVKRNRRV